MKVEHFKSGYWVKQNRYRAFLPESVDHEWTWDDPRINTLLEEATSALSELNAFSFIVPDIDLFTSMHVVKEASESSRIEGTQTEIGEAIRPIEEIDPERRDDWQEVQNYIQAMNKSIERLAELPLSNRLLKEAHTLLLDGVRGEHKAPGEWRSSQNWIGGSSLEDAVFIPPPHYEVPQLMGDLEKFWHNDQIHVPHLVRIAISHYQFETVHPFLDGNGRIGRLLITLYLIDKKLLAKPSLYLSSYLEKHKGAYYDALTTVRASGDLGHWIRFFLRAVRETARAGRDRFQQILALRSETEKKIAGLGSRSSKGQTLLNYLYKFPLVTVSEVVAILEVSHPTASKLIADMERMGILTELTGNQRYRLYSFEQYYQLFWGE